MKVSEKDYLQFSRRYYYWFFVHKIVATRNSAPLPVSMTPVRNSSFVSLTPPGNHSPVLVKPVRKSTIASLTPVDQSILAQHLSAVSVTQVTL
jgi:hypothetical protein